MNLEGYTTDELLVINEYLSYLQLYRMSIQRELQNISKLLEVRTKERQADIERLAALVENHDTGDAGLDEFVSDTASESAEAINNSGLEEQLNWLLDRGCSPSYILGRLTINVPLKGVRDRHVSIEFLHP